MDSIEENEGSSSSSDVDDQASDQTIAPEEDSSLMKASSNDRLLSGALGVQKWKEDIQMKGTTNPLYTAVHERRGSVRPQPSNTVLYEVKNSDTLAGVAARFNTTPSELVNLNRLSSRTIFPGQIIFVPETGEPSNLLEPDKTVDPINGQESPKPGHAERVQLLINKHLHVAENAPRSPSQLAEDLNKESLYKFLKIKAKHITDGEGVVSGVLLVTPNHLMFDPNVSDVLVIEHGVEKYGVVAPMHMVVRAALYPDIMRMRIKDVAQPSPCAMKLQLYRSKNLTMKKSRSHNEALVAAAPDSSLQKETKAAENNHPPLLTKISECSLELNVESEDLSKKSKEIKDVPEEPLPPPNQETENEPVVDNTADLDILVPKVPVVVTSPSIDRQSSCEDENVTESPSEAEPSKKKGGFEKTKQKLQKGLRRLSISDGLFPANLHQRRMSLPAAASFSELKLKSPTVPSFGKKNKNKEPKVKIETPSPSYMNMVDDKPELFASIEKLIPRPAKSFDDNPLYLCLRMGKPLKESVQTRFTPVMDFGRKMKAEYWFSIPREKVDSLYFFFLRWAPEKYGDIDDIDLEELGFAAIDEEEDDENDIVAGPPATFVPSQRRATWAFPWRRRKSEDAIEMGKDPSSLSWEFVHPEDAKESSLTESELSLPELTSPSSILSEEHIRKLNEHLPPRAVGYAWELIYSTAVNGFSLKTLYREMANYDSPVLLVIENTCGSVFGAMLSCPLRISDHFYGTGESFVFTFYPEFKYFPWSGDNNYFIKGNTGSFAIGASDGQFGLWLDDDLYHGCSKECETFRNDCLSDQEDFVVQALEAWGFV